MADQPNPNTPEPETKRLNYTRHYVVALSIIALLAIYSYNEISHHLRRGNEYASYIDGSVYQYALANRIGLQVSQYENLQDPDEQKTVIEKTKSTLAELTVLSLNLSLDLHRLSSLMPIDDEYDAALDKLLADLMGQPYSPINIDDIYYSEPYNLDHKFRNLISLTELFTATFNAEEQEKTATAIAELISTDIAEGTHELSSELQRASLTEYSIANGILKLYVGFMILALALVGTLIFRPLFRQVVRSEQLLQTKLRNEHDLRIISDRDATLNQKLANFAGYDLLYKGAEIDPSLDAICRFAAETLDVSQASVWHMTSDTLLRCARRYSTQRSNSAVPINGFDIIEHSGFFTPLATGKAMAITDAVHDPACSSLVDSYTKPNGIDAILAVPVRLQQDMWGILWLDQIGAGRIWSDGEVRFVERLADILSISLATHNMQELNASLEIARKAAEDAAQTKGQFLANMSHEIRTPLNGIVGITDLLQRSALPPKEAEFTKILQSSCQHLMEIVNDILDISKLEAGRVQLEHIAFNLHTLCHDVITLPLPRGAGVTSVLVYGDDMPRHFVGDPTRIRQVLMNLVSNALKFTEHGQVTLRVEGLPADEKHWNLNIVVEDTGIGMPAHKLESLFKKFSQLDESTTRKYGGTGLGLAISYEIMQLMNGALTVESIQGKGTRFTASFTMPLQTKDVAFAGSDTAAPVPIPAQRQKCHILLAEDNQTNQLVASYVLNELGCDYSIASNGQEALELIAAGTHFDMVLMDCQMPVLDGYAAAIAIRKLSYADKLPIIALTASALNDERGHCLAAGMNDLLTKPIKLNDVQRMITLHVPQKTLQSPTQPLYDKKQLADLFGNDPAMIKHILASFTENSLRLLKEITTAMTANDIESAKRGAHSIKGSCLNIYSTPLHDLCVELESALAGNNTVKAQSVSEKLSDLISTLRA